MTDNQSSGSVLLLEFYFNHYIQVNFYSISTTSWTSQCTTNTHHRIIDADDWAVSKSVFRLASASFACVTVFVFSVSMRVPNAATKLSDANSSVLHSLSKS